MFRTIRALFRIRQLTRIEKAARRAVRNARFLDDYLNATERPPTGDDYNILMGHIAYLDAALED
ncbi:MULTISPECIES: hypothetical protein [unclassified Bradyrhizobium]|uniref:hypothetical protein n=1 Tax=unclassified Bradyrhizobium TaxID=2631580 RepID=UPI0028ED64DB|nr:MULTISPECIES: hypothetical protein [unclassified Bradyrhizobium]